MDRILAIITDALELGELADILKATDRYEVEECGDGAAGYELAKSYLPDLILCDAVLPSPDFDGYRVLRRVRRDALTAHIPFVLLTPKIGWSIMRQGFSMGVDDYLVKPCSPEELISTVEVRIKRFEAISDHVEHGLESAKQRLLRMVTHELRTPLVPINMATEIISRQVGQISPDQLRELMETVYVGGQRLNHLIEQMVYITQIEAGMLKLETIKKNGIPARLRDVLMVSVDLARRFSYRHPDVTVRVEELDTESMVVIEKSALKHALAELITNAINFSSPGDEVEIALWRAEDVLWITILDHGPGIADDQLAEVMRGFHQIDRERQDQQGVGLGLQLAHGVITAHGGTLVLDSEVGKGTQVTVGLPVAAG